MLQSEIVSLTGLQTHLITVLAQKYGEIVRVNPQALALALFDQSISEDNPLGDEEYAKIIAQLFNPDNIAALQGYADEHKLRWFDDTELTAFLQQCRPPVQSIVALAKLT